MFNNWINLLEPIYFLQKIRRSPDFLRRVRSKVTKDKISRVKNCWSDVERPGNWYDIPAVQKRWNVMMTGDPAKRHHQYITEKYLIERTELKALSLGCGIGTKEKLWVDTEKIALLDAYDISKEAIKEAQDSVKETKYAHTIKFDVADVYKLQLPQDYYDLVLFEHSLHHFSPLETLLIQVRKTMKKDGLLVVNEFVGPSRFQWTDKQLEITNGLLAIFPRKYLTLWNSPLTRLRAWRPSKLWMWFSDPSEAVESSEIVPLLQKHFHIVEQKGYGGATLQLVFAGISHHFSSTDSNAQRWLQLCFDVEDILLETGEIEHDFALVICGKIPERFPESE